MTATVRRAGARPRVAVVYGTRPEAVKMAPVVRALRQENLVDVDVIVTGQHREMLDQVNELFDIIPDADLDIFAPGQSLEGITARSITGLGERFAAHPVDAVVVQGDTTTAFAGALAGYYAKVPVVHVEAGLRTGDLYSPFPEEGNRRLVGALASVHCAPTGDAAANLIREGISPDAVTVTGNTVIDALKHVARLAHPVGDPMVDEAIAECRRIVVVTAHRRESWDGGIRRIGLALEQLAVARPDVLFVVPVHANPLVREELLPPIESLANVRVLPPLSYGPFSHLLDNATVALTDSGGIQEEAPALDVPVLVTRETTERPEALAVGAAELVGTDVDAIVSRVAMLLDDAATYLRMAAAPSPFGDGVAAERVAAAVAAELGVGVRREEFRVGVLAEVAA